MTWFFKSALAPAAVLLLAAGLFAGPAGAQNLPRFEDYLEPIDKTLDYLRAGDLNGMDDHLAGIGFGSAGRVGAVIKKWLNRDQVEEISLLGEESLGQTVRRLTYAIRDSADSYMFVRFYVIRAGQGWVLYNFNFNTDLSEFHPGWKDPN